MKKILLILFLLFIPMFIKASTYSNFREVAGNYMNTGDYKLNYGKYIYTPTDSNFFYNNDSSYFKLGGMLNLEEFKITLKNNTRGIYYSYLYEGNPFWTITRGNVSNCNRWVIDSSISERDINSSINGVGLKVTEYVKPETSVVGYGSYSDPFIFSSKYKVLIKVNNAERGVFVDGKNNVSFVEYNLSSNDYKIIKFQLLDEYEYIGNTCGLILNDIQASSGILVISNVTRDTECTINFGVKPLLINLEQDSAATESYPKKLYMIPEYGWYSDEFANYSIGSLSKNPEKVGYTYKGYYKSNNFSNACSGTLVVHEDMKLSRDLSLLNSLKNNQTLYPCFIANTYTVTFDKNTGDSLSTTSKTVTFDQPYGELPSATKVGYTFDG